MNIRTKSTLLGSLVVSLVMLAIAGIAWTAGGDKKDFKFRYGAELGGNASGDVVDTDSTQTLKNKAMNVKTVWITKYNQLSQWSGSTPYTSGDAPATTGQSIYQIPATGTGVLYMIDPYAILMSPNSGNTNIQGSTTGYQNFTGVTIVLPSAAAPGNNNGVIGIGMGVAGTTGFDHLKTGATLVFVYPYAGTGSTMYGRANHKGTKPESLQYVYGTNGAIGTNEIGTGVSYWEINKPGEVVWYQLTANSEVSAWPVDRNVLN